MKENIVSLKDENGNKKDYRILFDIESFEDNKRYLIYTDDSKTKTGEIKVYASTYVLSKSGNITKLKPISSKEELFFVEKILSSIEGE